MSPSSKNADATPPQSVVDTAAVEAACRQILVAIGEDPDREGLRDTPARYARWWREFVEHPSGDWSASFSHSKQGQLIVVSGIESWTLCEHHLLPFSVRASVGYLCEGSVLGLSKFARIVHHHSHTLQIQERLTEDIAATVSAAAESPHVSVLVQGQHLCMGMRGVKTPAVMTTVAHLGDFETNELLRQEFSSLVAASA